MISTRKTEFIKEQTDFFLHTIDFHRLDTNNIHHQNHDVTKMDSMDNDFEKQVKDTLSGFDVQQDIGVTFNSAPRPFVRMQSVIVPYKKSVFFSKFPLVVFQSIIIYYILFLFSFFKQFLLEIKRVI
jgi:hypothetical protein